MIRNTPENCWKKIKNCTKKSAKVRKNAGGHKKNDQKIHTQKNERKFAAPSPPLQIDRAWAGDWVSVTLTRVPAHTLLDSSWATSTPQCRLHARLNCSYSGNWMTAKGRSRATVLRAGLAGIPPPPRLAPREAPGGWRQMSRDNPSRSGNKILHFSGYLTLFGAGEKNLG